MPKYFCRVCNDTIVAQDEMDKPICASCYMKDTNIKRDINKIAANGQKCPVAKCKKYIVPECKCKRCDNIFCISHRLWFDHYDICIGRKLKPQKINNITKTPVNVPKKEAPVNIPKKEAQVVPIKYISFRNIKKIIGYGLVSLFLYKLYHTIQKF